MVIVKNPNIRDLLPYIKEHGKEVNLPYEANPRFDLYESAIKSGEYEVFTAWEDREFLGYISIIYSLDLFSKERLDALIESFYVVPKHRKGLVAGRLYQKAIDSIKQKGANRVMASCKDGTDFAYLLSRKGFKKTEVIFEKEV